MKSNYTITIIPNENLRIELPNEVIISINFINNLGTLVILNVDDIKWNRTSLVEEGHAPKSKSW